jgi:hypothetical protein
VRDELLLSLSLRGYGEVVVVVVFIDFHFLDVRRR